MKRMLFIWHKSFLDWKELIWPRKSVLKKNIIGVRVFGIWKTAYQNRQIIKPGGTLLLMIMVLNAIF